MAAEQFDAQSTRARQARFGQAVGRTGITGLLIIGLILLGMGIVGLADGRSGGWVAFCPVLLIVMLAVWWRAQLSVVPPTGQGLNNRLHRDVLVHIKPKDELTPQLLWQRLASHWQVIFFANHLLLPSQMIEQHLSDQANDLLFVWDKAAELADAAKCAAIEPGHLAAALLLTAEPVHRLLTSQKLSLDDVTAVADWLGRDLTAMRASKPQFGGIGRDWANGFTPRLNQFGQNISTAIERYGAHFGALTESPGVQAIKTAFAQGSTAIALIGEDGVGKTRHAYALAQNLLAESKSQQLMHQQIIKLEPAPIISAARRPGELEYLMDILMGEAAHAGNIILFLDDAQLFFGDGPGSFNAAQLLLPVVQARGVRLILAFTPHDWQQLKSQQGTFASQLTPVVLQEPAEPAILAALADAATRFEIKHHLVITYPAIKEAYRLSGRYDQDTAYPGKAIRLLEQSLAKAEQGVVTAAAVQAAVEQATGVKVGTAGAVEADQLLHLEDDIHQRMINQDRAVSVVSNALRRARAGVANPSRPIGSFLFLGPTGVGKTELAKAIAATYFGDDTKLIRLDMSEYQQDSDVSRLLSSGAGETSSLIMQVRSSPFSVVLLDEIEKAHSGILNLLLQLLDEGKLTDSSGRAVSFKDTVVICTSNAGADLIRQHIERGEALESFEQAFTDELINSAQFKPELLNRFDEIVLFRPLKADELAQVVRLMLAEINHTLANQKITVTLTDAAISKIVDVGNDPRLGARPMRRVLQRAVEDTVAKKILSQQVQPGQTVMLDAPDLGL